MEYTEGTITLSRGEMDYIRFGSGEKTFVMLSGMTVAGLAGLGGPVSEAYAPFAADYTVYVFERLRVLPEGYSVRDMAADTAEALDALGIENADVMGASQGGMIGLYLAIDRPELVHSLVLAASCAYMDETGLLTMRCWSALADACDSVGIFRDFFRRVYTAYDPTLLAAIENSATEAQCRRFGILARACEAFDCRDEIGRVSCPTLAIGAEKDLVLGEKAERHTAELLGCEYFLCEGYAHAACDEAPYYKALLREFFDRTYASARNGEAT